MGENLLKRSCREDEKETGSTRSKVKRDKRDLSSLLLSVCVCVRSLFGFPMAQFADLVNIRDEPIGPLLNHVQWPFRVAVTRVQPT